MDVGIKMKVRSGFVSNSSSSSFIIRKSALTENQEMMIRIFFDAYGDGILDELNEDEKFFEGSVNCHRGTPWSGNLLRSNMLCKILENLNDEDFLCFADIGIYVDKNDNII